MSTTPEIDDTWTDIPPQQGYWWMWHPQELPDGCIVLMHNDGRHVWVYPPGFKPRRADSFHGAKWYGKSIMKPDIVALLGKEAA